MLSTCSTFLLVLVTVQFVVILHLLDDNNYKVNSNNDNNYKVNIRSNNNILEKTIDKSTTPLTLPASSLSSSSVSSSVSLSASSSLSSSSVSLSTSSSSSSTKKYEGVAITVILHSPTWFQRRYTMMVQNIVNNIPNNWTVQVFYTGEGQSEKGLEINRGLKRLIKKGIVHLTVIPEKIAKMKRKPKEIMTDLWIWKNMLADRVLVFGGNQVICSNSPYNLTSFEKWDYIGAPWDAFKRIGGDGGISLRNRSIMIKVLEYELAKTSDDKERDLAYKKWGQEDVFFVSRMLEMQSKGLIDPKIATREETLRFGAIGSAVNDDVLVASGTLGVLDHDAREKFLAICPELKLIFPSLHNPNCFGAAPNGEECAKNICALQPGPGGC